MNTNNWELTEKAKEQIPSWNKKWIDVITSTQKMSDYDREVTHNAILEMYKAAGLDHENLKIVFVPSPLMAAIVAGAAAAPSYSP